MKWFNRHKSSTSIESTANSSYIKNLENTLGVPCITLPKADYDRLHDSSIAWQKKHSEAVAELQLAYSEIEYLEKRKTALLLILAESHGLRVLDIPKKIIPAREIPEHIEVTKVNRV